jgi:ABC-type bacteriocin/lantibiotic exporter with double-glycine peptidase domain
MKIYKFISFYFNYLKLKDFFKIAINYLLVFLTIIFEILFLYLFFIIINKNDNVDNQEQFTSKIILFINNYYSLNLYNIENLIFILCLFLFLKNIFQLYQNYFFNNFIYKLTANKATNIFSNYLNFNYETFKKRNISTYSKNVLRDVENIILGILGLWIYIIGDVIYILSIIFFSSYLIFFKISFSQFILFLVIFVLFLMIYRLSIKIGKIRSDNEALAFKILNESLNFFKEIKINNKTKFFTERFSLYIDKYYYSKTISAVINITPKSILEIGFIFFFYLAFLNNNLSIENFISKFSIVIIIIFRVMQPLSRIFTYISSMFNNLESFRILYRDLQLSFVSKENIKKIIAIKSIKMNNISYSIKLDDYEKKIIKKFNYKFLKGRIYGLYGKSGSGKTTLLHLIAGLLRQDAGRIYFNGKKINSENIFRKYLVSYLPQNPSIFDENYVFNIFLNNSTSFNNLKKAKSLLQEFNLKNTLNLDKILNSVRNFSGGEKQRIGFIRSIINDPQVLLLDEPTSSLDRINENLFFNHLKKIKKDMIIIVSTHRMNHKKYFDRIIRI